MICVGSKCGRWMLGGTRTETWTERRSVFVWRVGLHKARIRNR